MERKALLSTLYEHRYHLSALVIHLFALFSVCVYIGVCYAKIKHIPVNIFMIVISFDSELNYFETDVY